MKVLRNAKSSTSCRSLDGRLATYLTAAGAVTAAMASDAQAIVVGNNTVQPFGVNGVVSIDFNQDGQTDFQIDHDRVDIGGGNIVDYLQVDKNDINGEGNPLAFDPIAGNQAATFPPGATTPNDANNSAYVIGGPQGSYPAALSLGSTIGPASSFDWQEGDNFQSSGKWIRANRLIDEDATQIDQVLGGQPASNVIVPTNGPNFVNLGGEVKYLGLKMELNNSGSFNYGWIGIRIPLTGTNEADATGEVVGYAYETTPGVGIAAGNVPEPTSLLTALIGGAAILGGFVLRRVRRS